VWRDIGNDILPETDPKLPFFNNILKKGEFSGISKSATQYNRYCRAHFDYFKWLEQRSS